MYHGMYVLNESGDPIPEPDFQRWGEWYEATRQRSYHGDPRRVALSHVGEWEISTVFLAVDHGWNHPKPVLWETMVFGPEPWDQWQDRYTSRADAEAGHQRILDLILAGKRPPDGYSP